jgi:hypothetical protein
MAALLAQAGCQGDRMPPPTPHPLPAGTRPVAVAQSQPVAGDDRSPAAPADAPPPGDELAEVTRFIDAYEQVGRPRVLIRVIHRTPNPDERPSRSMDDHSIEPALDDCFSSDGAVSLILPDSAQTSAAPSAAQDSHPVRPADELANADRLHADVLVLVRVESTHKSGVALQLVADACDVPGGRPLAHAMADVPAALSPSGLDQSARLLARKLMADITAAWTGPTPAARPATRPAQATIDEPG